MTGRVGIRYLVFVGQTGYADWRKGCPDDSYASIDEARKRALNLLSYSPYVDWFRILEEEDGLFSMDNLIYWGKKDSVKRKELPKGLAWFENLCISRGGTNS